MKPEDARSERSPSPAPDDTAAHPAEASLWEQFLARENLAEALRRVEQNAGAAGIDGMSTKELRPWLHSHWPEVRSALEAGTYRPQPVRRVMIPKPSGGMRKLGVPAAVDRLICQAIAQVLTPVFDPQFHPHSFGFRPGRSQHHAVERARQFIADDAAWCVDFDLDSFFDRVQHDALMARVARRVRDKQLLRLIRRYLEARLRLLTSRRWGVSMERRIFEINRYTVGWTAYFALADTPSPFRELDKWLRRRLRQVRWKEWKRVRTKLRMLRAAGIPEHDARRWAFSRKGYWRIAGSPVLSTALPNAYWTKLGLQGFADPYRRFRDAERTARCGPARRVVWGASG